MRVQPASVAAVHARIAQLEARRPSFAGVLETATRQIESAAPAAPASRPAGPVTLGTFLAGVGRSLPGGSPVAAAAAATYSSTSPPPDWAEALPERGKAWAPSIQQAAAEQGIDPRLLAALVWIESAFKPDAVSRAGAIGLAQLMPGTAAGLGVDPHDPQQNLRGGATYLRQMIDRFDDVKLALAAYNAGPGRVERGTAPLGPGSYAVNVLDRYQRLGGTP